MVTCRIVGISELQLGPRAPEVPMWDPQPSSVFQPELVVH
jgi:hypothetical protein